MGGGGGGGGRAFSIQSVTDRGPNVVNGYTKTVHQKFGKSVLQLRTSTMKQQRLFAYLMHVSKAIRYIFFKTLFLSVPFCIDHRRFTAGIKLFRHTGNVHAHLSPRLVAGLATTEQ